MFLEQALLNAQPRAAEKQLWIEIVAPDTPLLAYADPEKLRRILLNLVSNAVKFTEQGGITLQAQAAPEAGRRVDVVQRR